MIKVIYVYYKNYEEYKPIALFSSCSFKCKYLNIFTLKFS